MSVKEPAIGRKPKYPKYKAGRPPKLTLRDRAQLLDEFKTYVRGTDDPTLPDFVTSNEFALDNYVTTQNILDWQEFSLLVKQCVTKQESYLLRNSGGKYNAAVGIFRLKQPQHGYKDRVDTDVTTNGKDIGTPLTSEQLLQIANLEKANAANDKS